MNTVSKNEYVAEHLTTQYDLLKWYMSQNNQRFFLLKTKELYISCLNLMNDQA